MTTGGDAARRGILWLVLTAFLWSLLGLFGKTAQLLGLSPADTAFWRAAFGAAAFLVHCAATGALRMPAREALLTFLFGAWGIGAYYVLMQTTIELSGAAMDIILQYTAPFWVALFAWRLDREPLSRRKAAAILAAFAGTMLVCASGGSLGGPVSALGVAAGLLSGLCYATHFPVTRWAQRTLSTAQVFACMLSGGVAALLAADAVRGSLPALPSGAAAWAVVAAMGLACTYAAFCCYGRALRSVGLVQAVLTCELEPVLSVLWVSLLFGESFTAAGWAGAVLILACVAAVSVPER